MPVWYVISEMKNDRDMYGIIHIINVYKTTMEKIKSGTFNEEISRYYSQGILVYTMIVAREPDNPFKDFQKA